MKKHFLSFALCALTCWHANTSVTAQTIDLFNGNNLENWAFVVDKDAAKPSEIFQIKDGLLHIVGTPFGYMYTKEKYNNYKLHVEWRWPNGEATNSGIFLFVNPDKQMNTDFVWPNAIECQLHVGDAGDFVLLNGSDVKEFVVKPGEKRPDFPVVKKKHDTVEMGTGEWNCADISCSNGNITVFINGKFMNQATQSLHRSGYVALQSEGKDIQFRNIRLTPTK